MPKNILIVDDSQVQRDHLEKMCRELAPEARVEARADGNQALSMLREQPVDLVITDLEMPEMDGVLLARTIAEEQLAQGIVICSAKDPLLIASAGRMVEFGGLRVLGMLSKPVQRDLLQQSLEHFYVAQLATSANYDSPEIDDNDLRQAVDDDAIILHFQPKLTTSGLVLRGVEALARWNHPEKGFVPPQQFIAMAESLNLIDQLTFKLVDQGLEFISGVERYGMKMSISFNISPQSIAHPGFVQSLLDCVTRAGVDPRQVIFEVTENMLLSNLSESLQALTRLRLQNFGLSIDDFGAGFANAQQLSMLPATELKIDRSLVDGAAKTPRQSTILASTIQLGRDLDLVTVAEGVETAEDYVLLRELGAELVQGYFFAKPMPAEQLLKWVNSGLKKLRKLQAESHSETPG